jgi:hypothetical protein
MEKMMKNGGYIRSLCEKVCDNKHEQKQNGWLHIDNNAHKCGDTRHVLVPFLATMKMTGHAIFIRYLF